MDAGTQEGAGLTAGYGLQENRNCIGTHFRGEKVDKRWMLLGF